MLSITNTYGGYTAETSEDEDGFVTLLVYNKNNELVDSRVFLRVFMENEKDACEVLNSMEEDGPARVAVGPVLQCLIATAPRYAPYS